MIPTARGVPKFLFCVSTPKEREDMSISLPCVGKQFITIFFSRFRLCPSCRKGLEDKTYPAIDLPVNGESDSVSCVLVEYCIRKL